MAKQNKLDQIQKFVETAHLSLESARELLGQVIGTKDGAQPELADKAKEVGKVSAEGDEKIVEGVFDGQHMVGPDGKQYSIPANYASKSKLVAGDTLKLTIKPDGSFLYKQIGPVDRSRLVGILAKDETTDEYRVVVGDRSYKVLLASITYFKGDPGDEVVILIPKAQDTDWAAVENVIKVGEDGLSSEEQPSGEVIEGAQPEPQEGSPEETVPAESVEDIEEIS